MICLPIWRFEIGLDLNVEMQTCWALYYGVRPVDISGFPRDIKGN